MEAELNFSSSSPTNTRLTKKDFNEILEEMINKEEDETFAIYMEVHNENMKNVRSISSLYRGGKVGNNS